MNRSSIIILSTLLFFSCTNKLPKLTYTANTFNILLQNKNYYRYIFLTKDTAFYEAVQIEKPSYFTDLDTLIFNKNESIYYGKNSTLQNVSNSFVLAYTKGREINKKIIFIPANDKQISKWKIYKESLKVFQQ